MAASKKKGPGSSKRLTQAQRAKGRAKTAGKKKDPATGIVLAAASLAPGVGVAARGAAAARTAAAASKAATSKTKPTFTGERKDSSVTSVRKSKRERNAADAARKKAAKKGSEGPKQSQPKPTPKPKPKPKPKTSSGRVTSKTKIPGPGPASNTYRGEARANAAARRAARKKR